MKPAAQTAIDRLSPSESDRLHALIQHHLGATFPSAALCVRRQAETVFLGAWGWLDPYTQQLPAQADTRYDLASLTKLFTAACFLQQVSAGRVRLDDPLTTIIPEFGGLPRTMDGGQDPFTKAMLPPSHHPADAVVDPNGVTFRHLLTHMSGLAPWRATYLLHDIPPAPPLLPADPPHQRHRRTIAYICSSPFTAPPNQHIQYSDLGFMLLGEAVQRLADMPLAQAVHNGLCVPLGLTATGYCPIQAGTAAETIAPTEYDFGWRRRRLCGEVDDENAAGMGGTAGHAGLFGTAADVATFAEAWRVNDPRLKLSSAVYAEALAVYRDSTGQARRLGWAVGYGGGELPAGGQVSDSYGHTGFTGTSVMVIPSQQMTVVCLSNRVYYGRDPDGITLFRQALYSLFAGSGG